VSGDRVLKALHVLEDRVRDLPAERRHAAIDLAVGRLRRLRPRRGAERTVVSDARQLEIADVEQGRGVSVPEKPRKGPRARGVA
jgi:hypothetical protein